MSFVFGSRHRQVVDDDALAVLQLGQDGHAGGGPQTAFLGRWY